MFPIVTVPETIRTGMAPYREVFCREAGFDHVGRYGTRLILSPNKTLQGSYDAPVWEDGVQPSRQAMHAAVFEAGWDVDGLLPQHCTVVAPAHRGRGREVVCIDWTYAHHERGPHVWGVKKRWDHGERRVIETWSYRWAAEEAFVALKARLELCGIARYDTDHWGRPRVTSTRTSIIRASAIRRTWSAHIGRCAPGASG
jgi:hypothetical protein